MKVNHGLGPCTNEIEVTRTTLPSDHPVYPKRRLALVETPGIDNTEKGEYEILRKIAVWLASM